MASYKVIIDKQVRKKDLPKIPLKLARLVVERIRGLERDPYPPDSVQLRGRSERRIRQGDYRILYIVEAEKVTVLVVKVAHRREAYR
jgi:mRNA interferase RelE/StbE